jgi:hypothetical protein
LVWIVSNKMLKAIDKYGDFEYINSVVKYTLETIEELTVISEKEIKELQKTIH